VSGQVEHIWRWERRAWALSDKLCRDDLCRWVVLAHGCEYIDSADVKSPFGVFMCAENEA
jgi:hypothetical protein